MSNEVAIVAMDGEFPNCNDIEEFKNKIFANASFVRNWDQLDEPNLNFVSKVSGYISLEEGKLREVLSPHLLDFPLAYEDITETVPKNNSISASISGVWCMRAAKRLVEKTGWSKKDISSERTAVLISSSSGLTRGARRGFHNFFELHCKSKQLSIHMIDRHMAFSEAANVSCFLKTRGVTESTNSACASGLSNIGYGYRLIKHGIQDRAIVGGVEATSLETFLGFDAMRFVLSRGFEPEVSSRPFDKNRNGFVCSFGCGLLALENYEMAKSRGATILAVISNYYNNSDGDADMFAPNYDAQLSLWKQLMHSEKELPLPDVVKVHGTSTILGDPIELFSVVGSIGEKGYHLSAPKSQFGHMISATAAVETIVAIFMLNEQKVAPCLNSIELNEQPESAPLFQERKELRRPMAEFRELIPQKSFSKEINNIVCLNYGFGGANTSLYLSKNLH